VINMSALTRTIPVLILGFFGVIAAQQASAEAKIGVVNFQKLLEDAPQTKSAMSALDAEFTPRKRDLMAMQTELKAKDEKLQREGAVMAEADRAKAEKALRDEQREFSRKAGEWQDDVSTRRNEEIGKIQRFLVNEVQNYASTQGFDLVLADGVLYAKPQYDITAQVLAVLVTKPASLPAAPAGAAPQAKPMAPTSK